MSARRGVALLAALWLVGVIALAGAEFTRAAGARRALGLAAADRARDAAVLDGALAVVEARLTAEARGLVAATATRSGGRAAPSVIDPWADLGRRLADGVRVGDVPVEVRVTDLGTVRNVNFASETELQQLFAHVLRDQPAAADLAQAILDWRDDDDAPRARGGERDAYLAEGRGVLPANAAFRDLDDLRYLRGMTPARFAALRPFLTVEGTGARINLNAAPEPVLRTLPGMSPPLLAQLLALRAAGRRVESVPSLAAAAGRGAGTRRAGDDLQALRRLTQRTTTTTSDVLLELRVRGRGDGPAARRLVVLQRFGDGSLRREAVR